MKLIIIDKKECDIRIKNGALMIDAQKLPFHLIDALLIIGSHTLKTADLTRLGAEGIQVLLLSANFTQSAIIAPAGAKNAELKLAQYRACTTKALPIARIILSRKIAAHANQLKKHEIILETKRVIEQVREADSLDVLLGIEGSFSRAYFGYYFTLFPKTLHKGKRTKRPPLDPLNALLSWFYTLFYNLIAMRLTGFGFEASLGFLHRPFRSHMALASDLLELYRADINQFVYDVFAQKLVVPNDFSKKGGVYLRFEGRKKLWRPFREFSAALEPRIDESISEIRGLL